MSDELTQLLDYMYCSNCPYKFVCHFSSVFCPDIDDMKENENGSGEE